MAKKKFINQLYRKNKSSMVTSKMLQEQSVNAILADSENRTLWINGSPYGNAYVKPDTNNNYDRLDPSNKDIYGPIHAEIFNDFDNNTSEGDYSHTEGKGTQTYNEGEHAEGKYNYSIKSEDIEIDELDTDAKKSKGTISTIGIGTNEENRKNAFRVDNSGEVYIVSVESTLPDGRKVSYDPCTYDGTKKTVETRSLQEVIQGLGTMQEVTYGELRTLIDNKRLIPGMQYRITDYTNKFNNIYNKTFADNKFDIIVVADSTDTLNKNARACHHDFENELKDLVNKEININAYPVTFGDFYNKYYKLNESDRQDIISNIIYGNENPEDKEIYTIYNNIYNEIIDDANKIETNKNYFINSDIESWKIIYNIEPDNNYGIFDNSFYNEKIIINIGFIDDKGNLFRYLCEYSYLTDIYYVLGDIEYKYKWVLNKVQQLTGINSENISYFDDKAENKPYITDVSGLKDKATYGDTVYDDVIGLYLLTSSKYPTNENRGNFLFVSNTKEGKNTDQKYPYIENYENNNLKYNDVLLFNATTEINGNNNDYYFLYNGQEGDNYTWYIVENIDNANSKNIVLPGEYAYESSNWKKQEFSDSNGKYHILLKLNTFTPYPLLFNNISNYEIYKEYISYNENNSEKLNINNFGICEKDGNSEYMFFYQENIHIELTDKIFEYKDNNIKYYCAIWESDQLPNFIIITNPVKTIEETKSFKDLKINGNIKFLDENTNWENNYQIINITKETLNLSDFKGILYNKIIMKNTEETPISFLNINNPTGKKIEPFSKNEITVSFNLYDNYYIKENNESLYKTINNQQTLKYSTSDNPGFEILVDVNNYNTIIYYIDYVSKGVTYTNDDIFKFFNKEYNTTGYISELIDEFNNKANFDFKNILLNNSYLFSNNTNDLSLNNLVNNNNIYIDNIFNSDNYINIKSNSNDININFNTISSDKIDILCNSLVNNEIFNSSLQLSNINNIKNNNIVNCKLTSDTGIFYELSDNKIINSYLLFSTNILDGSNINIKNNIINNAYNYIDDTNDNILPLKISDTYENNVVYDYYKDNTNLKYFKDELSNDNQNRILLPNIQTYKVENNTQEQTISEESGEETSDTTNTPKYISIISGSICGSDITLLDGSDINNFGKDNGIITDYYVCKSNEINKEASSGQYYKFVIDNTIENVNNENINTNNYKITINISGKPQGSFTGKSGEKFDVFDYLFDPKYSDDKISCKVYLYKHNIDNYDIGNLKPSHITGIFSLQEETNNLYLEGSPGKNIFWRGTDSKKVQISKGKTLNINKILKDGWLSSDSNTYYQYNNGGLDDYINSKYSYISGSSNSGNYKILGNLVKDYTDVFENSIKIKAKANSGIILSAPAYCGNRTGDWDTVYKCPMIEPTNNVILGSSNEFTVEKGIKSDVTNSNIIFNLYKSQFNPNDTYYLYVRFFSYRENENKKYNVNTCTTSHYKDGIYNATINNSSLLKNINNLQTLPSCIIPLDITNIINNDENNFEFNFNITTFDFSISSIQIVDNNSVDRIQFNFSANFNLKSVKPKEYQIDKFLDLDYDNISSNYDKNNLIRFNNDNLIINSTNNIFNNLSSTSSTDFTFNKKINKSSYDNFTELLSCKNNSNDYFFTQGTGFVYGDNSKEIDFGNKKVSYEFTNFDYKIKIDESNDNYKKFTPKTNGIEDKANILNDDTYITKIDDIYPYFDPNNLNDGNSILVTEQNSLSINNINFNIEPIEGDNEPHLCFLTSFYRTLRYSSDIFKVKFSCDVVTTLKLNEDSEIVTTDYSTDYMDMEYGTSSFWHLADDDWKYCSGLFYINLFNILKHVKISTQYNKNEFSIQSVKFTNFKVYLNYWQGGGQDVTWIEVSNIQLTSGGKLRSLMEVMNASVISGFNPKTLSSNSMGCYSVLCGSKDNIDNNFKTNIIQKKTDTYNIRTKISASLTYYKVITKANTISDTTTDNILNNIVVSHNNGLSICNIPDIHNIDVSNLKINNSSVSLVNIPIGEISTNNKVTNVKLYSGVLFTYYHSNQINYKFIYLDSSFNIDTKTILKIGNIFIFSS